ncbi:MAG: proline--tRNA ligase [Anaerolineae bacterium]|jgi:prolyl-tRNA synthetase
MSRLFFKSLREDPAGADTASHRLLVRAGMVRQVAAGIFEYLPLGQRAMAKVEAVLRDEMNAIGGQEVTMPFVHPAELWQRSGRWYEIGNDMARLTDWGGRDYCLAMTHEEVVTDLAAQVVASHKQLPFTLYQIQTKFRDEPRSRAGLIRVREFTMKDGYSFHADYDDLDEYYPMVYRAYSRIFSRCGLDAIPVASDTGMMGGTMAHEFMALAPVGEDTIVICDACGYRANRQVATFVKERPAAEETGPLREVHTPGRTTIDSVAEFLGVPTSRTAKAVFLVADLAPSAVGGREPADGDAPFGELGPQEGLETDRALVFAVVRGDMELNETKLANAIGARALRSAEPEEIRGIGAEPGFGSPVGIERDGVIVVVDDLVANSPNLVGGANRVDYHYENVNHGRDFEADLVADIAAAAAGHGCPDCGAPLRAERGIEVGNIFKLGTKYSESMGASFLDQDGHSRPMVMGCYGIGVGRLVASVVEQSHDEDGIVWPVSIAPYHVSLVALQHPESPQVAETAERLYEELTSSGVEVLLDDRDERPGVKFNDADLIGLPLRLTIGSRGLAAGVVELRERASGEKVEVPLADAVAEVHERLERLRAELEATAAAAEG